MVQIFIIFYKDHDMVKTSILVVFVALGMMMSGCSKTWSGVKQDSSDAWNASKKAVHEATA